MEEQYQITWNEDKSCQLYWQETKLHTARLLGVYGSMPVLTLPEQIAGLPLTEIGDYCFAAASPYRKECLPKQTGIRALCGDYMEEIVLPDSVTALGRFAFYNCKNLRHLSIGAALVTIGSDAFMNAGRLHALTIRGSAGSVTGARPISAQITHDIEILFITGEEPEAKVLFPEYTESYDEIAPAHIFGRNIEGEGFRARQCFENGVLDFGEYDAVFTQACVDETEQTLGQMAEDRLLYPYGLSQMAKLQYEEYIKEHAEGLMLHAIKKQKLGILQLLCETKLVLTETLTQGIVECSRQGWAEGAAALLQWKQKRKTPQNRYTFDE